MYLIPTVYVHKSISQSSLVFLERVQHFFLSVLLHTKTIRVTCQ